MWLSSSSSSVDLQLGLNFCNAPTAMMPIDTDHFSLRDFSGVTSLVTFFRLQLVGLVHRFEY